MWFGFVGVNFRLTCHFLLVFLHVLLRIFIFSEEKMNTKNGKRPRRQLLFLAISLFIFILIPNLMEDNPAY